MATKQATIDYLLEQSAAAGGVSARKMFGEYALYCDGKLAALVCDDQLFVKPTAAGRAFAPGLPEAPPYPGAKLSLHVEGGLWEDADWLSALLRRTAADLPAPKPKAKRRK